MILKFDSFESRRSFLERLGHERADILRGLEPAAILPHVVATDLTAEQRTWLARHSEPGEAFEDTEFRAFVGAD